MSGKTSKQASTIPYLNSNLRIGEDIPFGPLPEEYNYRCSLCGSEMAIDEAVIDAEVFWAEHNGYCQDGFMPVLRCPDCNQETMEYVDTQSPPGGR